MSPLVETGPGYSLQILAGPYAMACACCGFFTAIPHAGISITYYQRIAIKLIAINQRDNLFANQFNSTH